MDGAPDIHADDFYAVLGVSKAASPDEIKRAYLALVRAYTPERAPEAFKRIREAYETLSDPTTRGQYDTRLDPRITDLLNQASEAMKAEDYSRAEQLYKQALLEGPGLDWVRNLLGICFLYQKRPQDAIAQYERVLQQPTVDPSMHANLAHAYAMAGRFDDAEREFRIAMSLAGDRGFEYGLVLLDMIADRGEVDKADRLAQELIKAAPKGSAAAAAYYAKQIDLALRVNRRPTIPALLVRMTRDLQTEEEKYIAAGMLGNVASRMIAGGLFDQAELVAKTAGKLLPEDPGFDALEQAGRLLRRKDFTGVRRLLRTHVAFAPGGVVQGLKPVIEQHLATGAVPESAPPQSQPASSSGGWGMGILVLLLVSSLTRLCNGGNSGSSLPVPMPPVESSSSGSTATDVVELLQGTQYAGVLSNITRSGKPVHAHIRLTFADLTAGGRGYLTVFPPLSGSGACLVRARGDSIRMAVLSGNDTFALVGARAGDTIAGTYRMLGVETGRQYGTWRAWRVNGTPIPARLDPW
jgi:tetratricopeptide (TPR) repeat protein